MIGDLGRFEDMMFRHFWTLASDLYKFGGKELVLAMRGCDIGGLLLPPN